MLSKWCQLNEWDIHITNHMSGANDSLSKVSHIFSGLESPRPANHTSIIRCLPFSLLLLRDALWHHCQRCGGGWASALAPTTIPVGSGTKQRVWELDLECTADRERQFSECPHRILCINITMDYFMYLHPCSCRKKYVDMLGRLVTEKNKVNKINQSLHFSLKVTQSEIALVLCTEQSAPHMSKCITVCGHAWCHQNEMLDS